MDSNNIILQLPFDESNGATVAYDYSQSRADGVVNGATFTQGRNGNAIRFAGDGSTCEVSPAIITNFATNWSMLMWVQSLQVDCGTPKKVIWLLNFAGENNFVEVPIEITPGSWYSLALTHSITGEYNIYVNSSLVQTIRRNDSLVGVSLNQDYYGSDGALGLLDDVVFYKVALTQQDLIEELSNTKNQAYLLDGVDLKEYGVYVSGSNGVVSRPKLKTPASINWDNYHGTMVDLNHKFYENREISLSCFIKADSKNDFVDKVTAFEHLFDAPGLHRLVVDVHPIKPLIFNVYCQDVIDVQKTWNDELMVGTFTLKLIEPEPVKRVLKHIRVSDSTKTCNIKLTSKKYLNVYWGDGTADYDVQGTDVAISHDYQVNGDYFPVICGCVDEITSFETNAIVVWQKL